MHEIKYNCICITAYEITFYKWVLNGLEMILLYENILYKNSMDIIDHIDV